MPNDRLVRIAMVCGFVAMLAGCDTPPPAPPEPLQVTPTVQPKPPGRSGAQPLTSGGLLVGPGRNREAVALGPPPPVTAPVAAGGNATDRRIPLPPVSEHLSLEQVTLPQFVNEVFSNTLHLTVQIDQRVGSRTDVITLRTSHPLPGEELFQTAAKVLAGYGVGLSWDGTVLHVAPDDALMAEMPELIRGRALPDMPTVLRPIFQIVDLQQVSAQDMVSWLTSAYGAKVKVLPVGKRNAIMLFGLPENVRLAVDALTVLDQARLAGRQSLLVSPVYWTAPELARKLVDVLHAEGYDASVSGGAPNTANTAVTLIPVEANNALIAFAADGKILAHIRQWIGDLDQAGHADPLRSIFVYQVQNTTATSLGQIVQSVLAQPGRGGAGATTEAPLENAGRTQPPTGQMGGGLGGAAGLGGGTGLGGGMAAQTTIPAPTTGGVAAATGAPADAPLDAGRAAGGAGAAPRLVIDTARNALVLIGTAQDYERIRPLLQQLDKAPREALIEVTVAELTLNDNTNLGFEWTLANKLGGGTVQRLGTGSNVLTNPATGAQIGNATAAAGLPLGAEGFNYTILNNIGDVRVLLNAFAENNRVSVLSTPRILAKSGGEAHIGVGTDVPIITSQGTTNQVQQNGNAGIIQSIEYRNTGVLLTVKPVVHSGNRIDLTISQEVSAAMPNSTPGITSPLISDRNVSTDLTLSDGQTVVIGGLISETRSTDDTGVPYLKDVPGLGLLFRNQAATKQRTELMVFITPFVVSSDADADALTQQFRTQMKDWPIPNATLHW